MPTNQETASTVLDWTARSEQPRRSVFGNYRAQEPSGITSTADKPAVSPAPITHLQSAIDLALARSFIYSFLSRAYADPASSEWAWLCDFQTQDALASATQVALTGSLRHAAETAVCPRFQLDQFDAFLNDYLSAFGHAARGQCPLNEIEYGDLKADPLIQPHRLADLAAFYRAFGLEVTDEAHERHDHLCLEAEFMSVLAAKEAYALEHQLDAEQVALCRDAQKKFLREHLGRWLPAFARRLGRMLGEGALVSLAHFTHAFVLAECARFDLTPGSDDLLLRPADREAESMCDSCGLRQLPPGAASGTTSGL